MNTPPSPEITSVFVDERADAARAAAGAAGPARPRNVDALERRMVLDRVGRLAVRDLPDDLALVQIDRGDASPWRFDERQSLHGQPAAAVVAAADADVVHVRALGIVHHRQHAQQRVRVDVEDAGVGIERAARPVGAVRDVERADLALRRRARSAA